MVEETKSAGEGATATAELPDAQAASPDAIKTAGPKPIRLPLQELSEEAKKKAAEDTGKPIEDTPYKVAGEEKLPDSVLRLKFEVAPEEFKKQLDRYYENLRKEIALPGYRKGKAPVRLVRIRMGEEGDRDAMVEAALNVMRQETIKRNLKLLVDPEVIRWKIEDEKPLEIDIDAEIEPVVEINEYKGLSVTVETREVTDHDVEHELEHLRENHATQETAPDGTKLAPGLGAVVDLRVESDTGRDLPHLRKENALVANPERELPEEVSKALMGRTVGETVTVPVKGVRQNRRGETIEHTDTHIVTLKEIKETKLPTLDDEFAKDLGEHDTLADLKAAIKKDLQEARDRNERNVAIGKIIAAIIEKNPIDAPRSRIGNLEIESLMRDSYQLQRVGLRLQDVVTDAPAYFASQHGAAQIQVKQQMLLPELAKKENLQVTEEDLEKEIAEVAERAGRKPLAVRARLEAEKKLDSMREELRSRKVYDFLLANNTIEKVPAKPHEHEHEHGHEHGHAH